MLVAQLGPTGGRKGYEAITKEPSSDKSAVWWINERLMPEIYVRRGKTYYFKVQVQRAQLFYTDLVLDTKNNIRVNEFIK